LTLIGWLVLAAGALWLLMAAAGWLLGFVAQLLEGSAYVAGKGAINLLDLLGKKHLQKKITTPEELLELEHKLNGHDAEKDALASYSPRIYSPAPLRDVIYEEELPTLFRLREKSENKSSVDIASVSDLVAIEEVPAYEVLKFILNEAEPVCSVPTLEAPKPVEPPINWTEFICPKVDCQIEIPLYKGVFSPLNFFVNRSYKAAVQQAKALNERMLQVDALVKTRNEEVQRLADLAKKKYENAEKYQQEKWTEISRAVQQTKDNFHKAYVSEMAEVDRLVKLGEGKTSTGLLARVEQTLRLQKFPEFVPHDFSVKYDENSKILILEHQFPDLGAIEWVKKVALKSGLTKKAANQKEAKDASLLLYPALTLRLATEMVRLDRDDLVEAIVVNGWANYTEKSTGQLKRAYCTSLFAQKNQLENLNLSAADPLAAFSALKGVAARSLELTPIAPILRLNTEDKRFVDAKDVLANMAQGDNLAAMDWEDFEHLCRELFEKAFAGSGAEVKVTQASRDQGVDAVIFDPDVLRGGKIVVQAKRYTNTVDVSAVRDLYGAIINEGATKGILVTTSHYGPDAYGFAKDKPITLLNGEELLGLLQKYGYSFKIDLVEAKRLNAEIFK
jgi:restriction system protein